MSVQVAMRDRKADSGYLSGWKAIAAYLGRNQSTARRWAAEAGMPVHRPLSGAARRGAAVYAFGPELDTWITRFGNGLPGPAAKAPGAAASGSMAETAAVFALPPAVPPSMPDAAPDADHQKAQALYLEAVYLWQMRSAAALSAAAARLVEAVELAPGFAAAHAELAVIYDLMVDYEALSEQIGYRLARQSARRALELAPGNARAHSVLADIDFYARRDFTASLEQYQTATRLDPSDPLCHHWLAAALSLVDRHPEARASIQAAKRLYPTSRQIIYTEAMNLLGSREFAEARRLLGDLVTFEPDFTNAWRFVAFAELGLGNGRGWAEAWGTCLDLKGDKEGGRILRSVNSSTLAPDTLAETVEALRTGLGPQGDPYLRAHLTALSGDWRQALVLLSEVQGCTAFYNVVDPAFAAARRQTEFRKGLADTRLPG